MPLNQSAAKSFAPLFLELLIAAVVISAALGLLLGEAQPAMFKARFINVLWAMSDQRTAVIEHYAFAGVWAGDAYVSSNEDSERRQDASPRDYVVGIEEGNVMATGTLAALGFSGGMRPAIAHAAQPWSVLWLCGARRPPAGWSAPPGSTQFALPERLVLSVCREGGT